ncbi:MAG TPA: hypothetical protein VMZ28_05430 [Kofleriaceae bacterium]|nr:hypothetical protein [Kofleriaceae bacterium]
MKPPPITAGQAPPKQPPANAVGGFTVEIPAYTLAAGAEKTPCWILPLEVEGPSRLVGGATLTVGPGMHHGNIVTRKKTGDGVRVCVGEERSALAQVSDVSNGGAVLFGSTTQLAGEEWQSFPPGMAYRIRDGYEIVARMHYLNASTQPLTVQPRYQWYTIDEATLTQELAPFAWDFQDLDIPPLSDYTVRGECAFVDAMHIVSVLPHMHALGTGFSAGFLGGPLDGKSWLSSRGYDPDQGVITQYDPAIDLGQGAGAWFSCSWHNSFDKRLVYGIGDNEMCTLFGYAYPPAASYSVYAKHGSCFVFGVGE